MKKEININLPLPDLEKGNMAIECNYETSESEDGRMRQVKFKLIFRKVDSNEN